MPIIFSLGPLPPNEFQGRSRVIREVCDRLQNTERLSTSLVGGPKTGATSILQYLASDYASRTHPTLAKSLNVYFSGESVGQSMTPSQFWVGVFRELRPHVTSVPIQSLLADTLEKARRNQIDLYDLEDMFDACANANCPVVLLINNFNILLRNENFWPPNDFFHNVRSLGQRHPRGLSFITATPRPLIDLWDPNKGASPFYNIFSTVSIGRLDEDEIREYVRGGLSKMGLDSDDAVENLVISASERHPHLVSFVAYLCADMLQKGNPIEESALERAFGEPGGTVVTLIRETRQQLSLSERHWVDTIRRAPNQVTQSQRDLLLKLWDYGLLPPGTKIQ